MRWISISSGLLIGVDIYIIIASSTILSILCMMDIICAMLRVTLSALDLQPGFEHHNLSNNPLLPSGSLKMGLLVHDDVNSSLDHPHPLQEYPLNFVSTCHEHER